VEVASLLKLAALNVHVPIPISGRRIYIETVLDITSTGPTVTVVNMHDE
jgi:hypothetical protein